MEITVKELKKLIREAVEEIMNEESWEEENVYECNECDEASPCEECAEAQSYAEEYLSEARKKKVKWIQKALHPTRKGDFTAKAKKAGRSVSAHAKHVLANTEDFDKKTVGQAKFALRAQKGFKK
jgi:hypothetical protein